MAFETYIKFLEIVDNDLRKIFDYQEEYIFCKEGCSHCCKNGDFPMTKLEFDYLMSAFEKLPEKKKAQIQENIKTLKVENPVSYTCPFLINEKCTVYQNRPLVCRAFGVLTEDVKGAPSFPFCAAMGLNFSQLFDEEKKLLVFAKAKEKNFKIMPKIFRLSNNVFINLPLVKEMGINFGEAKRMIDFL